MTARLLFLLVLLGAPEVRYEPTPMDVVGAMLELAAPGADDLVADLGCGDGRIVIEAVQRYGARGLCVDIDPRRIAEATANARRAGVEERIGFVNQDLLATDLRGVTVVMLFLSPDLNLRLRPKLWRELAPGARVVSHWHDMGDWRPLRTLRVRSDGRERPVYFWQVDSAHGSR
ncbi:MAG: methyltransferase domain-containing protein [Burkholderiales bacterium]